MSNYIIISSDYVLISSGTRVIAARSKNARWHTAAQKYTLLCSNEI